MAETSKSDKGSDTGHAAAATGFVAGAAGCSTFCGPVRIEPWVAAMQPPAKLRKLHDPRSAQIFLDRLLALLAHPVEIDQDQGTRRVHVVGSGVFEIAPDGTISVSAWRYAHGRAPWLEPLRDDKVVLDGCPHAWVWLRLLVDGFVAGLRRPHYPAAARAVSGYSAWLAERFRRRLARTADLRAMRGAVRAALALEPWAMSIARRAKASRSTLRVHTYNAVLRQRAPLRELDREAPDLAPLYVLVADASEFPDSGEPAWRLKTFLAAEGVSARLWRALTGRQRLRFGPFLDFYTGATCDAALDFLRVLDLLGTRALPPAWFLWTLMSHHGAPHAPRDAYASRIDDSRAAWARLAGLVERAADPAARARYRATFHDIASWITEPEFDTPDAVLRRLGWEGFVRRAGAWSAIRRLALAGDRWSTPVDRIVLGEFEVVALASGLDLWTEATTMRHCVDKYTARCAAGTLLVCSIRKARASRPAATVAFRRTPSHWSLDAIAGFANTHASPEAKDVAFAVQSTLNEQAASGTGRP